ncbi:uncharacterized protein LOC111326154 [Stylophora pistillata]|uniref:N-acetyltransferase domain-containing protein n=1 Tax=Stylophora pistillata TaxID=50429 RepID=A0A2B4SGQ7_STYPI|nr:uncharacterized protein LOC111326154 [Stylophora pistillata]PFX28536.1 hypothetical protein AWC38_SpisGene6744 [Stylophora pistillata]
MSDEWIERGFHIYQVQLNTQNRRKFRQVARDTCGESMEPQEDDLVMFGEKLDEKDPVVCVICAKLAKDDVEDPANIHYFHWINFLFVKGKFQRQGFGGQVLNAMEQELRRRRLRPIRLESAYKAVEFFKTHNYKQIGEPTDCVYSGSAIFRTLQTMEKFSRMQLLQHPWAR